MAHHHSTVLCDLPDSCLLHVFCTLQAPDTFQVASTCWRFHRLVSDRRLWLVVSPTGTERPAAAPGGAGPVYATLQAAVQASRPGDTIWLAPGVTHCAADVAIPWPLHLLGGGQHPSDTWLAAPQDADCALSFTASAKVAQLSVASTLSPCIIHKRGTLTLQDCVLRSEARGLYHLVSPVLTLAVSTAAASGGGSSISSSAGGELQDATTAPPPAAASIEVQVSAQPCHQDDSRHPPAAASNSSSSAAGSTTHMPCRPPPGIGPGKLQVVECQLMGGSAAVRCGGSGQLANVRAIYETHSRAPYFWLEVDSAKGPPPAGAPLHQQHLAAAASSAGGGAGADATAAVKAADASGLQLALLQQRSKAWQLQRRHQQQQQQQQQQHQQHDVLLPATSMMAVGLPPSCPNLGLARIQAVLGRRSINPASLAAHLTARQQQEQQAQEQEQS